MIAYQNNWFITEIKWPLPNVIQKYTDHSPSKILFGWEYRFELGLELGVNLVVGLFNLVLCYNCSDYLIIELLFLILETTIASNYFYFYFPTGRGGLPRPLELFASTYRDLVRKWYSSLRLFSLIVQSLLWMIHWWLTCDCLLTT